MESGIGINTPTTMIMRNRPLLRQIASIAGTFVEKMGICRIHVAACSTGAEAYSLAIELDRVGLLHKVQIIGTDQDPKLIENAKSGIIKPPDANRLFRYEFLKYVETNNNQLMFGQRLKSCIEFAVLNLVDGAAARSDSRRFEAEIVLANNLFANIDSANEQLKIFETLHKLTSSPLSYICIFGARSIELSNQLKKMVDMPVWTDLKLITESDPISSQRNIEDASFAIPVLAETFDEPDWIWRYGTIFRIGENDQSIEIVDEEKERLVATYLDDNAALKNAVISLLDEYDANGDWNSLIWTDELTGPALEWFGVLLSAQGKDGKIKVNHLSLLAEQPFADPGPTEGMVPDYLVRQVTPHARRYLFEDNISNGCRKLRQLDNPKITLSVSSSQVSDGQNLQILTKAAFDELPAPARSLFREKANLGQHNRLYELRSSLEHKHVSNLWCGQRKLEYKPETSGLRPVPDPPEVDTTEFSTDMPFEKPRSIELSSKTAYSSPSTAGPRGDAQAARPSERCGSHVFKRQSGSRIQTKPILASVRNSRVSYSSKRYSAPAGMKISAGMTGPKERDSESFAPILGPVLKKEQYDEIKHVWLRKCFNVSSDGKCYHWRPRRGWKTLAMALPQQHEVEEYSGEARLVDPEPDLDLLIFTSSIYLCTHDKAALVIERLVSRLKPGGFLVLPRAEGDLISSTLRKNSLEPVNWHSKSVIEGYKISRKLQKTIGTKRFSVLESSPGERDMLSFASVHQKNGGLTDPTDIAQKLPSIEIPVIEIRELQLKFRKHMSFLSRMRRPTNSDLKQRYAGLRDVSAQINFGDIVGIIGSNGSGKSTLLRTIAGVYPPDAGTLIVNGRIDIVTIGTGLNEQLTGRKNIFMMGRVIGMSYLQIRERMDEIIRFSGVGDAIDQRLRYYSSGMRARLAFAIATANDPDILLCDEVFAVGDREFRQGAVDRIKAMMRRASAVVIVSHQVAMLSQLANKIFWMEDGYLKMAGPTEEVLSAYRQNIIKPSGAK